MLETLILKSMEVPINWLAIVISMVASVVLGFLWYGPLFGRKWMVLTGIAIPEQKPPASHMVRPIIISLVGAFFMAYGLTHSLVFGDAYLNMSGAVSGLWGAFWNWLSFVVPVTLSTLAWEKPSWTLWMIHAGYWLVLLLIMGAVIAGMM
jgi:hypothetical protein